MNIQLDISINAYVPLKIVLDSIECLLVDPRNYNKQTVLLSKLVVTTIHQV